MKKGLSDNVSLFIKVLGDIFLVLGLFSGILYFMISILFKMKNVYPHDYFGLPFIISVGTVFILLALGSVGAVFSSKKKILPYAFIASSIITFAFLLSVFFIVLIKMKIGDNESFFTTAKFTFSFFVLWEAAMIAFGNTIPFLLIKRGYFNSFLHVISYIVEAILWVVLFIFMILRVSPACSILFIAFLFLRAGLYWWVLAEKKGLKKIFKVKKQ